jgi:hypothetical protein
MLYYIEAKVIIKVFGISGPWEKIIGYLVDAPNVQTAKQKYTSQVKKDNSNMEAESFTFDYLKIAPTI